MGRKTKMNSITSPELLAQVNPDNKQLTSDFIDYLRSTQRSETTINAYKNDLDIAWVWNLQNNGNKFYVDWTKRNVVAYQNWLLNNNQNSPARVRRLKASLSSLGNFIENVLDDEYPDFRNIINKIESPAMQAVREKTVLTDDQVQHLLDELVGKEEYERACAVALAMYSGRRKSELTRFRMSDFDDSHLVCDGALYKSDPIKTKGRSGGKYIPCYVLAKSFRPYLDMWRSYRDEHGIDSEWLFPSHTVDGEHLPVSTLDAWTPMLTKILGVDFYWHAARHRFTTYLAKAGIPDGVIQSIVAWESSDMVRLYKDIDAEEEIGMWFKDGEIVAPSIGGLSAL